MSARPAIDGVRTVDVPGGTLAYEEFAPGAEGAGDRPRETVLCVHGVSSQRRLWVWLADALGAVAPGVRLLAPDLRGRGDSVAVPSPFSMDVHADGGVPMDPPPGPTRDTVATAFADRVGRLERRFTGVEEYAEYFCSTTAPLLRADDPVLRRYLAHDLTADGAVRLDGRALVEDAADVFFGDHPWEAVRAPIRFLHAEWSVGAGSPPAYPLPVVEQRAARCVRVVEARQTDHAGTIMGAHGARLVADLVREAFA